MNQLLDSFEPSFEAYVDWETARNGQGLEMCEARRHIAFTLDRPYGGLGHQEQTHPFRNPGRHQTEDFSDGST